MRRIGKQLNWKRIFRPIEEVNLKKKPLSLAYSEITISFQDVYYVLKFCIQLFCWSEKRIPFSSNFDKI